MLYLVLEIDHDSPLPKDLLWAPQGALHCLSARTAAQDCRLGAGGKAAGGDEEAAATLHRERQLGGRSVRTLRLVALDAHPAAMDAGTEQQGSGSNTQLTLPFFTGNPTVELTKGLLHVYKDEHQGLASTSGKQPRQGALPAQRSSLVALLGVPAAFEVPDLLAFLAPVQAGIEHIRLIRDTEPSRYLALLAMRSQEQADQVYLHFNAQPYNLLEAELCHVMFVARVEVMHSRDMDLRLPFGLTELPSCAVCLERLDESVTGVLTTVCNHTFHCQCLKNWSYTSCPVCRHAQRGEASNECVACGAREGLWICLVCGSIGCGRYLDRHSYQHFVETQHMYAMELETRRVWDYVGDNYVHRLIQSTSDGKPIEVPSAAGDTEEKVDALTLEYTYLLTSQLESQRRYYTQQMAQRDAEHKATVEELERQLQALGHENERLGQLVRSSQSRADRLAQELHTERQLGLGLATNHQNMQAQLQAKDSQLADLQEQVRDLMFALDMQQKIEQAGPSAQQELREGQLVVQPGAERKPRRKKK